MAGRTLLCVLCLSTLNMYVCTHADTPVSAAKHNGSGSDLILNDCLAYLRFGRYWHEVAIRNAPSNVRHLGKSGLGTNNRPLRTLIDSVEKRLVIFGEQ